MVDQGYITQEEYDRYSPNQGETAIPTAKEIQPPAENSAAPYFTSWLRQQLVDRYGAGEAFGGGLQIKSTLDLELQRQVAGRSSAPRSAASARRPRSSCSTTRRPTCWRWWAGRTTRRPPFNLATNGHRQPGSSFKPFTLVTALEQGHSPDEVFTSAPQQIPFRAKVPKKNGKGSKVVPRALQGEQLRRLVPRLRLDHDRRPRTRTTPSTPSSGPRSGRRTSPRRRRRWASTPTCPRKTQYSIADGPFEPYNPALILGGLETGVTPLEMAHAYNTLAARRAAGLGHDGRQLGRTGRDHRRHRRRGLRLLPGRRAGARRDRRQRRQQGGREAGDRPRRRHRRPSRSSRPSSRQEPGTWRRPATRPGARPAPPTTTATPGSAVRRRGSPPASGSGSRTP